MGNAIRRKARIIRSEITGLIEPRYDQPRVPEGQEPDLFWKDEREGEALVKRPVRRKPSKGVELVCRGKGGGARVLEYLSGKMAPVDIPPADILRMDSEGIEFRGSDGTLKSAAWELMFLDEALNYMTDRQIGGMLDHSGIYMPEDGWDWSFIRDSDPELRRMAVEYVKGSPAYRQMKWLGLTSAEMV